MIKVRAGTFETNSSSTHSIVICSKKQFDEWKAGRCFFNTETDKFVVPDMSRVEEYKKEAVEQYENSTDKNEFAIVGMLQAKRAAESANCFILLTVFCSFLCIRRIQGGVRLQIDEKFFRFSQIIVVFLWLQMKNVMSS